MMQPPPRAQVCGLASSHCAANECLGLRMMRRLESVIARGASGGHTEMHDGSPPLELVMASTMKQVGYADRCRSARRFNSCEQRMIVDDRFLQEDFVASDPAMI